MNPTERLEHMQAEQTRLKKLLEALSTAPGKEVVRRIHRLLESMITLVKLVRENPEQQFDRDFDEIDRFMAADTPATPVVSESGDAMRYQLEVVWNREFDFVPHGIPHEELDLAIRAGKFLENMGDGESVKKFRVVDNTGKVVYDYGRKL